MSYLEDAISIAKKRTVVAGPFQNYLSENDPYHKQAQRIEHLFTPQEFAIVKKWATGEWGGDIYHEKDIWDKLYSHYMQEMPIQIANGDEGNQDEWVQNELIQDLGLEEV